MRIDLSPFREWGTGRLIRLCHDRLVGAAGTAVNVLRRLGPHEHAGRSGWAVTRVGSVTSVGADGEVDVAWDAGFDAGGWADLLGIAYEVAEGCPDVSEDPATYVPAEWRILGLNLMTPEQETETLAACTA